MRHIDWWEQQDYEDLDAKYFVTAVRNVGTRLAKFRSGGSLHVPSEASLVALQDLALHIDKMLAATEDDFEDLTQKAISILDRIEIDELDHEWSYTLNEAYRSLDQLQFV